MQVELHCDRCGRCSPTILDLTADAALTALHEEGPWFALGDGETFEDRIMRQSVGAALPRLRPAPAVLRARKAWGGCRANCWGSGRTAHQPSAVPRRLPGRRGVRKVCFPCLLPHSAPGGGRERGDASETVLALPHPERRLQAAQSFLATPAVHHDADAHLARVDHADVDAALGQGAEHPPGDAGVRPHADAEDVQLGDVGLGRHPAVGSMLSHHFLGASCPRPGRACGTVNDSSARSGSGMFCTIMSTTMPAAATAWKTREQLPGGRASSNDA